MFLGAPGMRIMPSKKICKYIIFKESALWAHSFYKSKCPYVCLFVCVSFCPSHFLSPFHGLFAPISRSPMSKTFRFFEFLGKSNKKKWSQTWYILLIKGVKSLWQKKVFTDLFHLLSPFKRFYTSLPEVQCQKLLEFGNPLGKVMERCGLRFENFCSKRV